MTQLEILEELKKLTTKERLKIIEAVLGQTDEDLRKSGQPVTGLGRKLELAKAAEALLPDYSGGGDLTDFTSLDAEDFHRESRELFD
jgi:hypothetical protein